jgi:cyclophilin family peptidyl-prolyl cis-trans isomerase
MSRLSTIILAALALAAFGAPAQAANPRVELDTTTGKIVIELYPDAAPKTVENFLAYVKAKHYDGTQFHRVIQGFMIQAGGYDAEFREKPTRPPVPNEAEQAVKAGLTNVPGTVAMARTNDPHSASAQFFINVNDNQAGLDFGKARDRWGYTVFGKVVEGMDVVKKIAATKTGPGGPFPKDVPAERVFIKAATVVGAP